MLAVVGSELYRLRPLVHKQALMQVSLHLSTTQTRYCNYGALSFWPISSLKIIDSGDRIAQGWLPDG